MPYPDRNAYPDRSAYPDRFYPVVDSVAWVARLALLGVGTIQLRAKNLGDADALQTVKDALDPAGVLAPGKNGVWPAAYRAPPGGKA